MKRIFALLISFFVVGIVHAQNTSGSGGLSTDPLLPLYILMGFIFLVALLVIVVAAYMINILNMFVRKSAEEKAAREGVQYVPELSWWARLDRKVLTGAVPLEKESTIVLAHNYDGIRELDNHLPPWWKWLFVATIIWGAIYLIVYHVTDTLPLQTEEYQTEVETAEVQIAKFKATQPVETLVDLSALVYEEDASILASGKKIYDSNCASCHVADGGGSIGPNLVDPYWLHGGSIQDIYHTIDAGVLDKGMISWKGILNPVQIKEVAFYIMSLQGTTPASPKAPQGEKYVPVETLEETPVPTDSVATSI